MFDIPKFTIQDSVDKYLPPQVSLTLEEIRQLSDDELLMLLSGEGRKEWCDSCTTSTSHKL